MPDRSIEGMNTSSPATLRYVPMPQEVADEARTTLRDRFGHWLSVVKVAAPCRLCLRISREPEPVILLSYQPSADTGPYAEIGPIFIHADPCRRYENAAQFPEDFACRRLILRAYGHHGNILDALVAQPGEAPVRSTELFANQDVAEIHVRHESYSCFDFKIVSTHERL